MHLRLPSLQIPRGQHAARLTLSSSVSEFMILEQLRQVRTLINSCLDIVDVSTWSGDRADASFISGQLRLLRENLVEAKTTLKTEDPSRLFPNHICDEKAFTAPLPDNVVVNLSVSDAALRLDIRLLELATASQETGFGRLAALALGTKRQEHDEVDMVFTCRGQQVKVKEKVKVESQDPSLMAVMAKLEALEHHVRIAIHALDAVMGKEDADQE
jgi:hypothetical protein